MTQKHPLRRFLQKSRFLLFTALFFELSTLSIAFVAYKTEGFQQITAAAKQNNGSETVTIKTVRTRTLHALPTSTDDELLSTVEENITIAQPAYADIPLIRGLTKLVYPSKN